MLRSLQSLLSTLLGPGCFVRRSRDDDAFFVTDAPRRLPDTDVEALRETLLQNGWIVLNPLQDVWRIDLSDEWFSALLAPYQTAEKPPFPHNDALMDVYTLWRLLYRHPSPFADQPRSPVRAILKRWEQPLELAAFSRIEWQTCAKRLRERRALPYAASGLLADWLNRQERKEPV